MEFFIVTVLLGLIPAAIAAHKGRSFFLWWFYGALLFIVALPMALLMKPKAGAALPEGTDRASKKARPDNYVPGWLVLVVLVALGGFIWFKAGGGSTDTASPSAASSPSATTNKNPNSSSGSQATRKTTSSTAPSSTTKSASNWVYNSSTDSMSGGKTESATLTSINSLHLAFPYGGENRGRIIVRKHPQYGLDVIITVDKGQILCGVYKCKLKVRFGDGAVQNFTAAPPSDHSSTAVFAKYPDWAIKNLRNAHKIHVQVPMYQQGNQVLTFNVGKVLTWPPK